MLAKMVFEERTFFSLPACPEGSRRANKRSVRKKVCNVTKASRKTETVDGFDAVNFLLSINDSFSSTNGIRSVETMKEEKKKNGPLKANRGHRMKRKISACRRDSKEEQKKFDRLCNKSGKNTDIDKDRKIENTAIEKKIDNKILYETLKGKSEVIQKFDNEKIRKDNLKSEKEWFYEKLKTETKGVAVSGLDFNDILDDDDSIDNKYDKEKETEKEWVKRRREREHKRYQVLTDKNYGLEEDGAEKLVVDIPASDNRYIEEREKETQEQTQVKTLDLLTMDMNKNSKEEKQSEKAMEKGALENSTALYGELHCRGSIENEYEENLESYMTTGIEEREGEEHSCYSDGESSQNDLPCDNEESLPLTLERAKEKVADDLYAQELAKIQAELVGDNSDTSRVDIECESARRIVSQEEHHVTLATNVETATGTDEAIATDGKELSEKEKLSLSYNDEKDDCEAQDLDWDSDNDVSCSPDNNAECSLDSDIQCSPDNDIPRNPDKEVEETGIVENRIDPENGERVVASEPEGSAADKLEVDVQEGSRSVAFEQDFSENIDLKMAEAHPLTYMLWVVMDTVLLCVIMETKQLVSMETEQEDNGLMGKSSVYSCVKEKSLKPIRLLATCSLKETSLKKRQPSTLPGPIHVCKFRKRKSPKDLKELEPPERPNGGYGWSKAKFCRRRRNKNAHVKWPRKDKMIDAPERCEGRNRRLPWLQGTGRFGRRCSDRYGGGAQGGGFYGNSGSREQGSGDWHHSGRHNGDDKGSDSNNNDNSYRDNGDYGENGSGDGRRPSRRRSAPRSNPEEEDSNVPDQDFKRYKKKHSQIGFDELMSFIGGLGAVIEERKGPVWELNDNPIRDCISCSIERPDELSEERISCEICNVLSSMLKHFADCQELYVACTMCMQVFSFICIHAHECKTNEYACGIKLCKKFHQVLGADSIPDRMKCLWVNMKKKLARVLGSDDGVLMSTPSVPVNPPNLPSLGGTRGFSPSLESISESGSDGSTSRSGSRVLTRKRSAKLPSLRESESLPFDIGDHSAESRPSAADEQSPPSRKITPGAAVKQAPPFGGDDALYLPVRKITPSRYESMPVTGGVGGLHGQYPSFTDKPVGTPGICEVMYGNVRQLIVVSKNWKDLKAKHQRQEALPRPYREEGIILRQYQEYLVIEEIRYKVDFQWLKLSHLGNGMSGKCHLAMDFKTDFKFCVKEIHIGKFEVEEIELWSQLDHPYIVKLYGAIRHGEMIYIFSEFIDGGNLTEAINTQRALNKRLSHRTALILFQQLLEFLVYLKEKHILHEDLKADNILLQRDKDTISIKVTDFGLATRINMPMRLGTKPVGTMTQWSPEKAECVRYGYPAEVWAAVCVLVHMVSGLPPWMRRYPELKSLIVVIVKQSPPVEDIPRNIPKVVRDLIERGFTVCQGERPTPEDLLRHEAFKLITGPSQRNDAYSILDSTFHIDNTELEDKNSDLQEIIRHLERKRPHAEAPVTQDVNRIPSGVQRVSVEGLNTPAAISQVPPQGPNDVTVGMVVLMPDDQDQLPGASVMRTSRPHRNFSTAGKQESSEASQEISEEDRLHHYVNFMRDDITPALNPDNIVAPYHPSLELENNDDPLFRYSIYDQLESHAFNDLLPNFAEIMGSSSGPTGNDEEDDSAEDEPEAPFDFNKHIEEVKMKYLTPTEEKERNPLIPTLPLVIESVITTSLGTGTTYSLTDSFTSNEGANVSGTISTEIHASNSRDTENVYNTANSEHDSNQHLQGGSKHDNASSVSNTDEMTLTEGEQYPSGDDLFKSGPGDLELVTAMERMSVTASATDAAPETEVVNTNVPAPSLTSPVGDEDLFGSFSMKQDDAGKIDVLQPVFLPMCSPSRNSDMAVREFVTQVSYQQQPLFSDTSEPKGTWTSSNTNSNAQQASTPMQPPSLNHTRFTLQPAGQYNVGLQMPSSTLQTNCQPGIGQPSPQPYHLPYPYSFAGLPTSTSAGQPTSTFAGLPTKNPQIDPYRFPGSQSSPNLPPKAASNPDQSRHNTPTNFPRNPKNEPERAEKMHLKPAGMENPKFSIGSSTSSSGELNLSPSFPPLSSGESPQMSNVGLPLLSTMVSQEAGKIEATLTTHNTTHGPTSTILTSNATSTPLRTQRKGKQEKDAMNEMLKSYQSTHGPIVEGQMVELTPPPQQSTPSTSPRLQRQNLHLNMNPQGPTVGPVPHVKSAPALERRISYPTDHHRVLPQPQSATPPKGGNRWPTSSPGSGSESASTKSQFERQAEALAELQHELETSSHHSHSHSHSESNLHLSLLEREGLADEAVEDPLDDQFDPENVPESFKKYITVNEERKVTVLFICPSRSTPIKMKFGSYHRTWREILKDDLCRSKAIHKDFGCDRFCLKFLDGTPVGLSQVLGEEDITVAVVQASDDDPWCVEGGQIFFLN